MLCCLGRALFANRKLPSESIEFDHATVWVTVTRGNPGKRIEIQNREGISIKNFKLSLRTARSNENFRSSKPVTVCTQGQNEQEICQFQFVQRVRTNNPVSVWVFTRRVKMTRRYASFSLYTRSEWTGDMPVSVCTQWQNIQSDNKTHNGCASLHGRDDLFLFFAFQSCSSARHFFFQTLANSDAIHLLRSATLRMSKAHH